MFDSYRLRMAALGSYDGEARRRNAQKIMDASWMRDPATKPVYVKWVNSGLPMIDDDDIPVYAKFNVKSYHNITGDEVAYLLQFRHEDMRANLDIKVGSYVQIKNEMDEPEWWLMVHYDDRTQFRQFSILKCTWIYKWVSKVDGHRVIHECLGAPREQNSYNSGTWLDYTFQIVENQDVFWVPTNDDTKTIMYDTKFLKSVEGRYPPIAYKVSKIEDTATLGITRFTMTQEQFDPVRDNVELMIANYFDFKVNPELPEPEVIPSVSNLEITYSGTPSVRAGGGYKKFTLKAKIDDVLEDVNGIVEWDVNGVAINTTDDAGQKVDMGGIKEALTCLAKGNIFKVKCTDTYSLIRKTFVVTAKNNNNSKSIVVEVASL